MNFDVKRIIPYFLIGAGGLLLIKQKRRWWVRPWIRERELNCQGNINLLHNGLSTLDANNFKNFIRMDENTFHLLLDLVKNDISRKDTMWRNSISARDRLTITLRYLATGETYKSLEYSFRVGQSTISKIVPEVCAAIYKNLKKEYLTVVIPMMFLFIFYHI